MGAGWFRLTDTEAQEVEVFSNTFWSDGDAGWTGGGGCNLQYPIFYGGAKHIIKGAGNGGGRCAWWEACHGLGSAAVPLLVAVSLNTFVPARQSREIKST